MKNVLLCHPDTVSGTTILENGTQAHWGEGYTDIVVKYANGHKARICPLAPLTADEQELVESIETANNSIDTLRMQMNHIQVQGWNNARTGKLVPLIPLDSPELKGGPYTDEQFQNGNIAMPDCGMLYGYVYCPERFTGDPNGVMGTSGYTPLTTDKNGRTKFGQKMPFFAERDDAVKYLVDRGFYGRVQRYACDEKFLRGIEQEAILMSGSLAVKLPPAPWITAGVTDVVNIHHDIGEDSFHGQLLDVLRNQPTLHRAPKSEVIPF